MTTPRDPRPPVVVVAGPTAAGKTRVALALAERFEGEIVNADSMQVYRGMDIGTAKPSPAERARVPHHGIDLVEPDFPYDAGRFLRDARAAATQIHGRGRPVFLTGGTGLYIRAFLEGLLEGPGVDRALRARLEADSVEALHEQLTVLDPEAAARIHPHDQRRLVRAVEIRLQTGRPASELRRAHAFLDRPYRSLYLVLDPGREALAARIDARCVAMIQAGLLQEVRALRSRGFGPTLRSMQSIGYRHLEPVVAGRETLAGALGAMQRDTRRFARRQRTWFRSVSEAVWMNPDDADAVFEAVEAFLSGAESGISTRRSSSCS